MRLGDPNAAPDVAKVKALLTNSAAHRLGPRHAPVRLFPSPASTARRLAISNCNELRLSRFDLVARAHDCNGCRIREDRYQQHNTLVSAAKGIPTAYFGDIIANLYSLDATTGEYVCAPMTITALP